MSTVAFFDVDYTLVDGNTGFYTSLRLIQHRVLKKRRLLQSLYYLIRARATEEEIKKIYQIAIDDMQGKTKDYIFGIGRECFEKDVKQRIFPQALDIIRKHQAQGDKVVLISSGPTMTLEALKNYLQADAAYSIGPVIENHVLTNEIPSPLCHAEGKVYYAKLYCAASGLKLEDSIFYSDHYSDLPLFEVVARPVVVNPKRKMKKIALQKGWEILKFKR